METQTAGGGRRALLILGAGAVAALIAVAFIVFGGGPSKASAPATLDVLAPSVSTRADAVSNFQPARSGQPLRVGDSLRTDASGLAGITYFDGSLTRIGPGTTYAIEQFSRPKDGRQIVGRLDVGQTFHRVTKVTGSNSRFEVKTSHAVAAVRGTVFFQDCPAGSDTCRIGVTEGSVAVESDSGQKVVLQGGQQTTVDGDGDVGKPELISDSDPWVEQNRKLDERGAAPATTVPSRSQEDADESSSDDDESDSASDTSAPATTRRPATTQAPATTAAPAPAANANAPTPPATSSPPAAQTTTTGAPTTTTAPPTTTTSNTPDTEPGDQTTTTGNTTTTTRPPTTTTASPSTTTTAPPQQAGGGGGTSSQSTSTTAAPTTSSSSTSSSSTSSSSTSSSSTSSSSTSSTTPPPPDLTIAMTRGGTFTQGSGGGQYVITVTNAGSGSTNAPVKVTDTLPQGLRTDSEPAMSGEGWTCESETLTCTRADTLAASSSWPVITLKVRVDGDSDASEVNHAEVSGGGDTTPANNSVSHTTPITQVPDLVVDKTHTGDFVRGQSDATYTIKVRNQGGAPTLDVPAAAQKPDPASGVVEVIDTLPPGLRATALAGGEGWTCRYETLSCWRTASIPARSFAPDIILTVDVADDAPDQVENQVSVSGGGEQNTTNNSDSDPTNIASAAPTTTTTGPCDSTTTSHPGGGGTCGTVTIPAPNMQESGSNQSANLPYFFAASFLAGLLVLRRWQWSG